MYMSLSCYHATHTYQPIVGLLAPYLNNTSLPVSFKLADYLLLSAADKNECKYLLTFTKNYTKPSDTLKFTPKPPTESAKFTKSTYVDLGPRFFDYYSWSNDEMDLEIETYFNPDKEEANISTDFGFELLPIIRKKHSDLFFLMDKRNNYYKWEPWTCMLWRLEGFGKMDPFTAAR